MVNYLLDRHRELCSGKKIHYLIHLRLYACLSFSLFPQSLSSSFSLLPSPPSSLWLLQYYTVVMDQWWDGFRHPCPLLSPPACAMPSLNFPGSC